MAGGINKMNLSEDAGPDVQSQDVLLERADRE